MSLEDMQPIQEHLWNDMAVSLVYFAVTAVIVLAVDAVRKWIYKKIEEGDDEDKEDEDDSE